ncbi:MAG: alpha/beta hydrolase [Candidatus Hydrogenedentota bacterium]
MRLFTTTLLACVLATSIAFANGDAIFDEVDHHFTKNGDTKLHYVSTGKGPVVLFVHGFPDFWYSWRHQMEGLKKDFKVVAMDTRGYNKSDQPQDIPSFTLDILLADVDAVIKDLGVDDVTLVGHDWGGAISWRFAMLYPDRVNKLIICNLTHPKGYATVRANATPEQKANTKYIENFQAPDAHKMFNAKMVSNMVAGKEPAEVKARYEAAFERSSFNSMLNYYRAVWPVLTSETPEEVPDLNIPVLQFHGLLDSAVDKDGLRDTWNWITEDYTLVAVPKKGHWIQTEAPELVTTTMKWWLLSRP